MPTPREEAIAALETAATLCDGSAAMPALALSQVRGLVAHALASVRAVEETKRPRRVKSAASIQDGEGA